MVLVFFLLFVETVEVAVSREGIARGGAEQQPSTSRQWERRNWSSVLLGLKSQCLLGYGFRRNVILS